MTAAPELAFLSAGGVMGRRIADLDWSATPLGPVQDWPAGLRAAVGIMLESRHPMLIWWGPTFSVLYNDAAMALLADKHPTALGRPGRAVFAEIWATIGPTLHAVLENCEATWAEDQRLVMNRLGLVEEIYWTCSFSPLRGADGRVRGVFTATTDTTARVVGARRLDTLQALGGAASAGSSVEQAMSAALETLAGNPSDVPYAAVYLTPEVGGSPAAEELRLVAAYGLDPGSPLLAPPDPTGLMLRALATGEPVLVTEPAAAVAMQITAPGPGHQPGVLVLGTSPLRPLDEDYRSFLDIVGARVSAALGAAAPHHARTGEAALAGRSPTLTWVSDAAGRLVQVNGAWREFTGADLTGGLDDRTARLHPDDVAGYRLRTVTARAAGRSWEAEYRLRRADGQYRRLLEHAVPLDGADRWIGSCTDVTELHRRGERRQQEAQERLRRSEAAFRLLAEHADDVIARHDLDGTWRYLSPSVRRTIGHDPIGLVGSNPLDLMHPEDREAAAATLTALRADRPGFATVRFRHADGRWRWFEVRARLVRDEHTGETELHTSTRDITDRLLAEQTSSRFRALAERAEDFIGMAGRDGRGLYLNPAGRSLVEMEPDRPAGEFAMLDMIAPADRKRFVGEVVPAVERDGSWAGDIELVNRTGDTIPVRQTMVAHRDRRGRIDYYSTVCRDLRERRRAETALHRERERYRSLVAQAPVGIWTSDPAGNTTFVNEQMAVLTRSRPAELLGPDWHRLVHPEDLPAAAATWSDTLQTGAPWSHDYRMVLLDGTIRHVTSSARSLRDADGAITGFLGTTTDVTEQQRAEVIRRDAATEDAAREVAAAAAARLRAMVEGLAAIVWEADWDAERGALRFTFVSERAEELLGYPAKRLRGDPKAWPRVIHPDDRAEAVTYSLRSIAAGRDHDHFYRARTADGRVLWLHQVVHVVCDAAGEPLRAQGLTVDVTEVKRAERSAELLAETGRLIADGKTVEQTLAAVATLVMHDFGDGALVSLFGHDGLSRRVAVAHVDPDVEVALRRLPSSRLIPALAAVLAPGKPVLIPIDEIGLEPPAASEPPAALVVPLVAAGHVLGLLGFLSSGRPRQFDDADLELAAELGRRASLMVQADRQRQREHQMQQVSADLASAASVPEAARLLVDRLADVLGAAAMSVCLVEPDRGIRMVFPTGYDAAMLARHRSIRFDDPVPIAEVVRSGAPVWIRNREEWQLSWPDLLPEAVAEDRHGAATLPLTTGGRVVGTVGMSFATPREFPADEREFMMALVAQAAPAFERAATADERRQIAETLQTSLLPLTLPELDRLGLAARYLPGTHGTAAGGDWYDVLPLDGARVAVAVGDVVGQGARAAAVMGQLRSALSAYLLEGHDPVRALEHLDAFAGRVSAAAGSTVACLVLDTGTGELVWGRAGHPPPLVVGPRGARFLDEAMGTVLAVRGRPPFTAGRATLLAGESVVLYTDGLVERRGEVIDKGLERLAAAAQRWHASAPAPLADAMLAGTLVADGPSDDVAVIVARLLPGPLRRTLPAHPARLRKLRIDVQAWAAAAGLAGSTADDLQLALGEAAANAVEHAYRDAAPGLMHIDLSRDLDGTVRAGVRDHGTWQPPADNKGFRGRGLDLVRELSGAMAVNFGADGTEVRFVLPPSPPRASPPADPPPSPRTATLR